MGIGGIGEVLGDIDIRRLHCYNDNMLAQSNQSSALQLPNVFSKYVDSYQLIELWRRDNPLKQDYIFFSNHHLTFSRIDFIMASKKLDVNMGSAQIGDRTLSDYAFVIVEWAVIEDSFRSRY